MVADSAWPSVRPSGAPAASENRAVLKISRASPFTERLRLARLLAARGLIRLHASLGCSMLWFAQWRSRPPERLLIAPQDIRTGDPTTAADIYAGYYAFGGKIVNAHGRSPFSINPPSLEWARVLAGFGWLRHLRAADTSLARANARALVKEFILLRGRPSNGNDPAWESDVVARRTLSFLSQSPMLLEGVNFDDYRRVMRVLARGFWRLNQEASDGLAGESRLTAAIAMSSFALCAQGGAPLLKRAVPLLIEQLNKQILPDGGPIGRNPQTLLDLLLDLLPLRQAFAARGQAPPPELLNAIDRIMPALRMFRHGDGSLALFNGMGATAADRIATVLAHEDTRGQPLENARYSGYQRLEANNALVIIDTGPPPPPLFSRAAHAGCLSFEFSLDRERVIINCGSPGVNRPSLNASARATAAHSTLTLDDVSSCAFGAQTGLRSWFGDEVIAGPQQVPVHRDETAAGVSLVASHDGYLSRFGLIHERGLVLLADGLRLAGTDRLIATPGLSPPDVNYVIRFHLHPSVATKRTSDGAGVLLQLASGATLLFEAGGLPVDVEESIFFASPGGPRPCEQIIVYGSAGDISEISWSITRWRQADDAAALI